MQAYEPLLNKLSAFGTSDPSVESLCALELENAAQEVQCMTRIPVLTKENMSQITELIEAFPPSSKATRALLAFVASLSLRDENRQIAVQFGLSSTCVLLLQQHKDLSNETLYYVFDLVSTLSANDGLARQQLRPGIPYIIAVLGSRKENIDVLLGGAISLSTLSMISNANSELTVERGGLQALINAYGYVSEQAAQVKRKSGSSRDQGEDACENALFWIKDALRKLCLAPLPSVDEALKAADFGVYGKNIAVDELKWTLTFERKKVKVQ
ncbi:hypothetical protein AGDE_04035 [Angomonas deanei]|uniref:Uncharacterized protein n=1 Tax=Angomonas deanei TaxID=59799 RepID=S9VG75_9TRYP|nr:hypothetical protein AGDE_11859 [Angomonas deanei]EPY26095.1 hypothetical protein AGDE_11543 [Angomonas deanei]EPY39893.1 hypothetical protein AGDE_04035 [Angomonas deanei]CAD2215482.1 hypothetical protein, conserved [Angomonas deanei]|eukprot:EPY25348.1 hypothetical protein AGDE_11859 [Angomonas deanei]